MNFAIKLIIVTLKKPLFLRFFNIHNYFQDFAYLIELGKTLSVSFENGSTFKQLTESPKTTLLSSSTE